MKNVHDIHNEVDEQHFEYETLLELLPNIPHFLDIFNTIPDKDLLNSDIEERAIHLWQLMDDRLKQTFEHVNMRFPEDIRYAHQLILKTNDLHDPIAIAELITELQAITPNIDWHYANFKAAYDILLYSSMPKTGGAERAMIEAKAKVALFARVKDYVRLLLLTIYKTRGELQSLLKLEQNLASPAALDRL